MKSLEDRTLGFFFGFFVCSPECETHALAQGGLDCSHLSFCKYQMLYSQPVKSLEARRLGFFFFLVLT